MSGPRESDMIPIIGDTVRIKAPKGMAHGEAQRVAEAALGHHSKGESLFAFSKQTLSVIFSDLLDGGAHMGEMGKGLQRLVHEIGGAFWPGVDEATHMDLLRLNAIAVRAATLIREDGIVAMGYARLDALRFTVGGETYDVPAGPVLSQAMQPGLVWRLLAAKVAKAVMEQIEAGKAVESAEDAKGG